MKSVGSCLFFILVLVKLSRSNPLVGETYYCKREGAVIEVANGILEDESCYMCRCKNHRVECTHRSCPSMDGCYRVLSQSKSQCCSSCMGCIYNQTKVSHGRWWSEGCNTHECHSGVLTSSESQCYVPCANPFPPEEGQCCPKCNDCWMEGRRLREGESVPLRQDPCVKCKCQAGQLSCMKRSCPVLSCPSNKAIIGPDGCCPVCDGSREMFTPPGGRCFLGRHLYMRGANHTFDSCTTCVCDMGHLQCQRKTCPPLTCPRKYRQREIGDCCASCVYPKQSQMCSYAGALKEHGEVWFLDKCTTCNCSHGRVTCQVDHCEYLLKDCPLGYKKVQLEDSCCPQCQEDPGICLVYGNTHYKTFDGNFFDFHGECRYDLAKDCSNGRNGLFSIRLNNDARPSPYFPWSRSLLVKIRTDQGERKISLSQKLRTKVDRRREKLPYFDQDINITRKGHRVSFRTKIGLEITWDGAKYVQVILDATWQGQTCGVCGNFNKNATDDYKNRGGELVLESEEMASSWQSGKTKSCMQRLRKKKLMAPEANQIRTQRLSCVKSPNESRDRCSVLNETFFESCRNKVSIENFYQTCIRDLCECPSLEPCACDSIVAFVEECQRAHVDVSGWRSVTKCGGLECPYGSLFMKCAPACKSSCKNLTPNPNCHMRRCKPGCYCPPPTVLHRGYCILPEKCPKRKRKKSKRIIPF